MAPVSPVHRQGCARLGFARLKAFRLNVYEPVIFTWVGGAGIGGAPGRGLRIEGASIQQVLNDQTDTASFRASGFVPVAGQTIQVLTGQYIEANKTIFAGRILETTRLYESRKQNEAFDIRCIDPTWLLGRRLVLASFKGIYAADIINYLMAVYSRGVTWNNVTIPRSALYIIDEITFTNEALPVCLTVICERIGANWYLDYQNDLHAFINEPINANTITDAAPHGAAELQLTEDLSQVATRVIGRGGGAGAAVDIPAGAAELPVDENEQTWYASGLVETGTQVISYAGVRGRGGLGSFVGAGNAPAGSPLPTPYQGSSHTIGATYGYAITFTTAAGETLIGPSSSIKIVAMNMIAPPGLTARSRGAGSYPPGMITPPNGPGTQIRFACQIIYMNAANGPLGASGPTYTWDGNDWEVYIGNSAPYLDGHYFPLLEPNGPVWPVSTVQVFRSENGAAWVHAGYIGYQSSAGWHYQMCAGYGSGGPRPVNGVGSVYLKEIPKSSVPAVTGRKVYRTPANGSALKLLTTIANNTATEYLDTSADAALGAAPPASDTSGVKDEGQVVPGATSLPVASVQPFVDDGGMAAGGWVRIGTMPVRYTSIGANALTGIPATGNGSITAVTKYGTQVLVQPRLFGIPPSGTGAIVADVRRGDAVVIRIEKQDDAACAAMAARFGSADPADGVIEIPVSDSRFTLTELAEHIEATLQDRKDPHLTLSFISRDLSLEVGRLITVNTTQPPISGTFRIQRITLSEIAITGGLARVHPLKRVEASNKLYKFSDLLRRLRSVEGGVR